MHSICIKKIALADRDAIASPCFTMGVMLVNCLSLSHDDETILAIPSRLGAGGSVGFMCGRGFFLRIRPVDVIFSNAFSSRVDMSVPSRKLRLPT